MSRESVVATLHCLQYYYYWTRLWIRYGHPLVHDDHDSPRPTKVYTFYIWKIGKETNRHVSTPLAPRRSLSPPFARDLRRLLRYQFSFSTELAYYHHHWLWRNFSFSSNDIDGALQCNQQTPTTPMGNHPARAFRLLHVFSHSLLRIKSIIIDKLLRTRPCSLQLLPLFYWHLILPFPLSLFTQTSQSHY